MSDSKVLLLLAIAIFLPAAERVLAQGIPNTQIRSHTAGQVFLTVSNYGIVGYYESFWDVEDTLLWVPVCEYPKGSGFNFLYQGAIWIGAKVDSDSLVSVGNDGWLRVHEMFPDAFPNGGISRLSNVPTDSDYSTSAVATEEFVAEYFDTLTDPAYVEMTYDEVLHQPLGLEVRQHSYGFSTSPLTDVVIFKIDLSNIGDHFLHELYIGLRFDTDIYCKNRYTPDYYLEDISGLYSSADGYPIAWSADNDGDPENGEWTEHSPCDVFGVSLLDFPGTPSVNFNWYRSWGENDLDWGPAQVEGSSEVGLDSVQTPVTNAQQYYTLARDEQDYDQLWATIDFGGEGWWPPPDSEEYAIDLANGTDTRFIYSFGPADLAPGDSLTFAFVIAMGEDFHTDPTAFDNLFDPYDPGLFYNTLDFADLVDKVDAAREWYDSVFGTPLGVDEVATPPARFALEQNFPNPFNSSTVIEYSVHTPMRGYLEVFNLLGQKVRELSFNHNKPGHYEFTWDGRDQNGRDVPSGIYLYRIRKACGTQVRKMLLLR